MKAKSSLKTALLLILCLCSTLCFELSAINLPLVKNETSDVSFITPEIKTISGESVEVCLANNLHTSFDLKRVDLSLSRYINDTHSTLSNYQVTFLPGIRQVCFELHIPSAVTTANYILEIEGEKESLSIATNPSETTQVAWCGAAPLTNPDITEQTVAMDNFGNYYTPSSIYIPNPIPSSEETLTNLLSSNCGCDEVGINLSLFDLYFEDCIYNSGMGFDDSSDGPERREALCASLAYLEGLIVSNQSICNPGEIRRVNIKVLPSGPVSDYPASLSPMPENVLGYATPFYTQYSGYVGIRHPWPWEIINSGEYPVPPVDEEFYHALTRINFQSSEISWQLDYTMPVTGDRYDLYTVGLHEFTHAIGFGSSFNNTVGEIGSRQGLGKYNNFDQHLQITYDAAASYLDLIENGTAINGFPFSHEWYFNDEVDGLGINDPNDPSDLHSSCPGTGPHLTFQGEIAHYPLYTGNVFQAGSSFSHFDGNCSSPNIGFINYVMNPSINVNSFRRRFQWQELDALRTLGYNIDCSEEDFLDANPSDNLTFNCNASDAVCAVASVPDTRVNLEECGNITPLLSISTCPGEHTEIVSVSSLHSLLLANDPNAMSIAFINPVFGENIGTFERVEDNYSLTTQSWANFSFYYAPLRCNGAVGNVSIFTISTFPGENCEGIFPCELLTCENINIPPDWEGCMVFDQCEEHLCDENLVCNGQFCGLIASTDEIIPNTVFRFDFFGGINTPFDDLDPNIETFANPYSWIKGSGSADYIIPGNAADLPALGLYYDPSDFQGLEYFEGAYTYLTVTPEVGNNYLFSADFEKGQPIFDPTEEAGLAVRLIQGQSYTPCGNSDQFCYDSNAPEQMVFDPTDVLFPEENRFRGASCFTIQDNFNALLLQSISREEQLYTVIDNIELIPDNFSAGENLTSEQCNQVHTLGGEPFCMLEDVELEYSWFELDENGDVIEPALLTFTQEDILLGNPISFDVAPERTTTYRLTRTITDLADLPADFTLCTLEDEVTIIVLEQLPIPDFTAELLTDGCGLYNFFSDPTAVGATHSWYFDEVIATNLFSNDANPTNVQLSSGTVRVIHIVQNDCGIEEFEILLEVDCEDGFTCPCEGIDAINIDAGDGTLLSELIDDGLMPSNGIDNRCLAIKGELRIDQAIAGSSYVITYSELKMQPGASIVVEAGASLSLGFNDVNGGIHGCEELWQGISLEPGFLFNPEGGKLFVKYSTIGDAVYAVKLGNLTTFSMYNTTLDRNHVGIYTAPSTNTQVVFQPTFVQESTISSTNDLLDPYPGQVVSTASKSFAGIELNNCKGFQVGGGNIIGAEITNSNYGIISRQSNLKVYNSRIHGTIIDPNDLRSSTGVLAELGSDVLLRKNRFHDLRYGMYGENVVLRAIGNVIGEDLNGNLGNLVNSGIVLRMSIGTSARIFENNNIYAQRYGILVTQAHQANIIQIENNILELMPPAASTTNFDAIRLGDGVMSGDNDAISIVDNKIKLHNDGYGISLYNVNGATISENAITFAPSYNTLAGSKFGLLLYQASNNTIYNNIIEDEGTTSSTGGMYVVDGDMNKLCCNTALNTYKGAQFFGDCIATELRHTTFDGNHIGLQCNQNTLIGEQNAAGNRWLNNGFLKGRHLSLDFFDVVESQFFASPTQGVEFYPSPNELFTASNTQWFFDGLLSVNCSADEACDVNALESLSKDSVFAEKILNDNFYYGDYPATSEWEANWPFYRSQKATEIQDQASWPSVSQAFFNQQVQNNSVLHQIVSNAESLEELLALDMELKTASDSVELITEELYQLDLTLVDGENPSAGYLDNRTTLLNRYGDYLDIYRNVITNKETTYQILLDSLLQENNSIIANEEAASTMVEVNGYYLDILLNQYDTLPSVIELGLTTIAESCPNRFGSAVTRAQSILLQFEKSFSATNDCRGGERRDIDFSPGGEKILNRSLVNSDFRVYPNPSSGIINIQLTSEFGESEFNTVEIFDMAGRLHYTNTIRSSLSQINTEDLVSGVYWLRLRSETSTASKRIIIN